VTTRIYGVAAVAASLGVAACHVDHLLTRALMRAQVVSTTTAGAIAVDVPCVTFVVRDGPLAGDWMLAGLRSAWALRTCGFALGLAGLQRGDGDVLLALHLRASAHALTFTDVRIAWARSQPKSLGDLAWSALRWLGRNAFTLGSS
jgi:hypothetical protein